MQETVMILGSEYDYKPDTLSPRNGHVDNVRIFYDGGKFKYRDTSGNYQDGIPQITLTSADGDKYSILSYVPQKIHFGSVSVGGVTSGGVYTTGGHYIGETFTRSNTGKVHIFCTCGDYKYEVERLSVNKSILKNCAIGYDIPNANVSRIFSRYSSPYAYDPFHEEFALYDLTHSADARKYSQFAVTASARSMSLASEAFAIADEKKLLTQEEATAVLDWINSLLDKLQQKTAKEHWAEFPDEYKKLTEERQELEERKASTQAELDKLVADSGVEEMEAKLKQLNQNLKFSGLFQFKEKSKLKADIQEITDSLTKAKSKLEQDKAPFSEALKQITTSLEATELKLNRPWDKE